MIIWARRHRNLCFTLLKVNSMGFQSGSYATLYTQRSFNYFISFLLSFALCTLKLSINKQTLASPFSSLSFVRYSLNFGTFTDFGNSMKSSYPFSREIPDSTAIVGSLIQFLSTVTFLFYKQYSVRGTVLRVNTVSSM